MKNSYRVDAVLLKDIFLILCARAQDKDYHEIGSLVEKIEQVHALIGYGKDRDVDLAWEHFYDEWNKPHFMNEAFYSNRQVLRCEHCGAPDLTIKEDGGPCLICATTIECGKEPRGLPRDIRDYLPSPGPVSHCGATWESVSDFGVERGKVNERCVGGMGG